MGEYAGAWCAAVVAGGHRPGVYVTHRICPVVQAWRPDARIWAIFVTTTDPEVIPAPYPEDEPSGSGVPGAFIWQCRQAGIIDIAGEPGQFSPIDFDTALSADPSA
jgi:hypothetical protein